MSTCCVNRFCSRYALEDSSLCLQCYEKRQKKLKEIMAAKAAPKPQKRRYRMRW